MPYTVLEPEQTQGGGFKVLEPETSTVESHPMIRAALTGLMQGAAPVLRTVAGPMATPESMQGSVTEGVTGMGKLLGLPTGPEGMINLERVGLPMPKRMAMGPDGIIRVIPDEGPMAISQGIARRFPMVSQLALAAAEQSGLGVGAGIKHGLLEEGTKFTTPENIGIGLSLAGFGAAGAPADTALLNKLAGTFFMSKILGEAVPPQAAETIRNPTAENVGRLTALVGGGLAGTRALAEPLPTQPSGIRPGDIASHRTIEDLPFVTDPRGEGQRRPVYEGPTTPMAPRTSMQDVPIIGQRPLVIQQPIVRPEAQPQVPNIDYRFALPRRGPEPTFPPAAPQGFPLGEGPTAPTAAMVAARQSGVPSQLLAREVAAREGQVPMGRERQVGEAPIELEGGFGGGSIDWKKVGKFISTAGGLVKKYPSEAEFIRNLAERYPFPEKGQEGFNKELDVRPVQELSDYYNKVGGDWRIGLQFYQMLAEQNAQERAQRPGEFPDRPPPEKLFGGAGATKPEDLRPAINYMGRILVGERGDTHADVLKRNGISPDAIAHADPRRGFVDVNKPNDFLDRVKAAKVANLTGTADAGGLDSMDLPGAARAAALREAGLTEADLGEPKNAVRELRTDKLPQAQPPGDIPPVEKEIRGRTEAEGAAQEKTQLKSPIELHGGIGSPKPIRGERSNEWLFSGWMAPGGTYHSNDNLWGHGDTLDALIGKASYEDGWSRNYARISQEGNTVEVDTGMGRAKLDEKQVAELKNIGIENNLKVWDPDTRKVYYDPQARESLMAGVGPIFDPSFYGSDENARQARERYASMLTNIDPRGARRLRQNSPTQHESTDVRTKAILDNPNAKPMNYVKETVNQPGQEPRFSDAVKNSLAPLINAAKEADVIVNPQDVLYDMLDGGKASYNGPLMEHIRKPLDDDFNDALAIIAVAKAPITKMIKEGKMGPRESERIAVYINAKQEGGVDRMISSGVSPFTINDIVQNITPKEKAVGDAMLKFYSDSFKPLAKVAEEADGVKLIKRDNYSPWQREYRKYRPNADEIATNPVLRTDAARRQGVLPDDVLWPGLPYERPATATPGFIRERRGRVSNVTGKAAIRLDSFQTLDRFVRDYAHYVTSRKHIVEMGKIVRSPEFAAKYGDLGQKLITESLNVFARQGRYKRNAFADILRRHVGVGVIAWRPASQLVHMANIPLAIQRTGAAWWAKGLDETFSQEGRDFLHKHFAETYARGGGEPELAEIMQYQARTKFGKAYYKVGRGGFWVQRILDQKNAQATVLGIYMRKLSEKGLDPTDYANIPVDKDAVRQARVEARRAVASPIYKDRPILLSRGGSWTKSVMQFQNTFLDQWSNIRYDLAQAGVSKAISGNPKLAMEMTLAVAAMLAVETTIKYGYKSAMASATGDKLHESDTYWKTLEHEALRRIPGMGQLQAQLFYGETGIPSIDVALSVPKEGYKAIKSDELSQKMLSSTRAVGAGLEAVGVPGTSVMQDIATGVEKGQLFKPHTARVEKQAGKPLESMDIADRIVAEEQYKATERPLTAIEKGRAAERSVANITKRGIALTGQLPKGDQQWLKTRGLTLPGYDNKMNFLGHKVYLTEKESKDYEKMLMAGYGEAMGVLKENYDDLDETERREFFAKVTKVVRDQAHELMHQRLMSNPESGTDQKKKKRFSVFSTE